MGQLKQDLSYAFRQLRKSPGFVATAVTTLALGIGANTAAFTLMYEIVLKSLPVPNPGQLYQIGDGFDCCTVAGFLGPDGDFYMFSYDLYLQLKKSAPEFEQLAAIPAEEHHWSVRRGNADTLSLSGQFVSGNYFAALSLSPSQGRLFFDSDDAPNAAPVAVLSYRAWKEDFGGDPTIVGSTVHIQTHPFAVVGIAPARFSGERFTGAPPAIWIPLASEPLVAGTNSHLHNPYINWLVTIGRVRNGTEIASLQSKLSASLREWLVASPAYNLADEKAGIPKQHVVVVPASKGLPVMGSIFSSGVRTLILLSAVVLLIACANIANLLLVRGIARRAESSIRVAFGAGRVRLIRQILTESLLLSCIGGFAGLVVAFVSSYLIFAMAFPDAKDLPIQSTPSLPVLAFAFGLSLITGVLFGIAPVRLSLRVQPAEVLRGLNRSTRGISSLPQRILIIFQAALSLTLLVAASLTTRSLYKLATQKLNFAVENRYVLHLDVEAAGYSVERLPALYNQIASRFSRLGGVTGVGLAGYSLMEGNNWGTCVVQEGGSTPHNFEGCNSTWDSVSPGYLNVMGLSMVRGREFEDQDKIGSPRVVIVSETFVNQFYPHQDPIGRRFRTGKVTSPYAEIVGVFKDIKTQWLGQQVRPVFFRPVAQTEGSEGFINSIVIRFKREPEDVESLLRSALASVDPNLTVSDLRSMDSQISDGLSYDKLVARLAVAFGLLAATFVSIGLYGVTSYIVAQRTGEIGIRMALGATRTDVIRLVIRGVMGQIGLGLALGIPCSLYAGYLMKDQLFDVRWYDPIGLIGTALLLASCGLAAGFFPARRAASIEPMTALRAE